MKYTVWVIKQYNYKEKQVSQYFNNHDSVY